MTTYFDTYLSEKGVDLEERFEVEGPSGTNFMCYQNVLDGINQTVGFEREAIKKTFVMIDFKNGDIKHYLRHLAQAIAQ